MDQGHDVRIDESCRRRFEAHRIADGRKPLDRFLPSPGAPSYLATLEELVCIEWEFVWKRGGRPDVDATLKRFPGLADPAIAQRLRDEAAMLERRFAGPRDAHRGMRIGHYELREIVGAGAFARVWRAWDFDLKREVAIKIPRAELCGDEAILARVRREAQAAARLRHPGIVPVHEVGEDEGRPFIVSELVEGESLSAVGRSGPIAPERAAEWVAQIAEALDYAHQCGVIHRDIKPGNILLSESGHAVLTDFGLAWFAEADAELTGHGEMLGTPAYMSPEQARGAVNEIDTRTDVYGLGVVLYELLCGGPPFRGGGTERLVYAVVHEQPRAPRAIRPGLDRDIETICLRAMEKNPGERYADPGEMAADLRRYRKHETILARRRGLGGRLQLWIRRNPALAATMAASAAIVIAITAIAFSQVLNERDQSRSNEFRALLGEAEAILLAREGDWLERAMASLRTAARMHPEGADRNRLRDLVIRCLSVKGPRLHQQRESPAPPDAVAVAVDESGAHHFWITRSGALIAERERIIRKRGVTALAVRNGVLAAGDDDGVVHLYATGAPADGPPASTFRMDAGAISALAFAPDGGALAVGTRDGWLRMLASDTETYEWREPIAAHCGSVTSVAFGPDGNQVASAGEDAILRVWDATTGELAGTYPTKDAARTICFVDGGKTLLWASWEHYDFRSIRPDSPRPLDSYRARHGGRVIHVSSLGGGRVASVSSDGSIKCWIGNREIASANERSRIVAATTDGKGTLHVVREDGRLTEWSLLESDARRYFRTTQCADFVGDSGDLAVGDGILRDLFASGPPVRPAQTWGAGSEWACIAVEPGGQRIFGGRSDGTIQCVGEGARAWSAHHGKVAAVLVRDGRLISAGADGRIRTWDLEGTPVAERDGEVGPIHAIAATPDGRWLVVAGRSGCRRFAADDKSLVLSAKRTDAVATTDGMVAMGGASGTIEIVALRDGAAQRKLVGNFGRAVDLRFSPDARVLASTTTDGSIRLWDTSTGQRIAIPHPAQLSPRWVRFDPRGRFLVAGGSDFPQVFDVESRKWILSLECTGKSRAEFDPRTGSFFLAAGGGVWRWLGKEFETDRAQRLRAPSDTLLTGRHRIAPWGTTASADGHWVVTTGHTGSVLLWNTRTRKLAHAFATEGEIAWDAAFSPDGETLAAGMGSDVRVWDRRTGAERARLVGHSKLVTAVEYQPDGTRIVTASMDGTVRLWDARSGEPIRTLHSSDRPVYDLAFGTGVLAAACGNGSILLWRDGNPKPQVVQAHDSAAWAVEFDRQGRFLASGSHAGDVVLRDARTLRRIATFQADIVHVRSLRFAASGRFLAAGCWESDSVVWDLERIRDALRSMGLALEGAP